MSAPASAAAPTSAATTVPVRVEVDERPGFAVNGWPVLAGLVVALLAAALLVFLGIPVRAGETVSVPLVVAGGLLALLALLIATGLSIVSPGETRVVTFFGSYTGTVRRTGLSWTVPLTMRRKVPVRVQNFETATLKVNEKTGSPVQVSAIVVWQVADTAKATFAVDYYRDFIETQAEAALRHVVATHPYDVQAEAAATDRSESEVEHEPSVVTLREDGGRVADELVEELDERIRIAGLEVLEVRLSNLSYAPEIAGAMLQRQQAQAVLDARRVVVNGAVGMVADALDTLEREAGFALDSERKAAMTSNLLTVLVGGHATQPVVNVGSLYS